MKILKTFAAAAAVTIATVGVAAAHSSKPIDRTIDAQNAQIDEARRTGALTKREYAALKAEQDRIEAMRNEALRDRNLTAREVRVLREAQRDAQNHILSESHDRQVNFLRKWKAKHFD